MPTPRLMVVVFVATGVVVAAVIALTLQSWWVLAAVVMLHAIAAILVVGYALRKAGETGDKPDPVSEARIEEERSRSGGARRPTMSPNDTEGRADPSDAGHISGPGPRAGPAGSTAKGPSEQKRLTAEEHTLPIRAGPLQGPLGES
jgi:hypothetical protein